MISRFVYKKSCTQSRPSTPDTSHHESELQVSDHEENMDWIRKPMGDDGLTVHNPVSGWTDLHFINYFCKKINFAKYSTGPAPVSGWGGGGDPLCIDKQEVGTYIYSLLYTHTGLLG